MHRIGIDVVPTARVEKSLDKFGPAFTSRFLTSSEMDQVSKRSGNSRVSTVAGRIAAKEAVMKVLGDGWPNLSWTEIEVIALDRGRPEVRLYGKALEAASCLGIETLDVSITHDGGLAIAVALGVLRCQGDSPQTPEGGVS